MQKEYCLKLQNLDNRPKKLEHETSKLNSLLVAQVLVLMQLIISLHTLVKVQE